MTENLPNCTKMRKIPHSVTHLSPICHLPKTLYPSVFQACWVTDDRFFAIFCCVFPSFFVFLQLHLPSRSEKHIEVCRPSGGVLHCGISDTVRFVFDYLNYHNQNLFQRQCRGDAYGCVYTQPKCAEGLLCPHAHFWVHCIYTF